MPGTDFLPLQLQTALPMCSWEVHPVLPYFNLLVTFFSQAIIGAYSWFGPAEYAIPSSAGNALCVCGVDAIGLFCRIWRLLTWLALWSSFILHKFKTIMMYSLVIVLWLHCAFDLFTSCFALALLCTYTPSLAAYQTTCECNVCRSGHGRGSLW